MKHKNRTRGNVLFIILIAIALFAAFTAAVTKTNSGGGGEQAGFFAISATQIMRYGSTVKSAVDQLRQQGISESDISFANDIVSGYGTVGANPSGEVFHIEGGGITYEPPEANWLDSTWSNKEGYGEWYFTGKNSIRLIGEPAGGGCSTSDCIELVAVLSFVKEEICHKINESIQLTSDGSIPQDLAGIVIARDSDKFNGIFSYTSLINDAGGLNAAGAMDGRYNFCIGVSGASNSYYPEGSYHYFQVLIAR